jgi:hypothetical protein
MARPMIAEPMPWPRSAGATKSFQRYVPLEVESAMQFGHVHRSVTQTATADRLAAAVGADDQIVRSERRLR